MKRAVYTIVVLFVTQSCSFRSAQRHLVCEEELPTVLGRTTIADGTMFVGKARIDLPKYRLRGACRIMYVPPDGLRLDFKHSSLFGAYREDASIFLQAGTMVIYDRARNRFFGNDSSIVVLTDALGMNVFPDDLFYALLLKVFSCAAIDSVDMRAGGGDWDLSGLWRGRRIALSGKEDTGIHSFELCSGDGSICYTIRYAYSGNRNGHIYPKRITMTGKGDDRRLSLDIIEIKDDIDTSVIFEVGASGDRFTF